MKIPHSPEAEKGLLSCLLQDPRCLDLIIADADPSALFHDGSLRLVWETCVDLARESREIGLIPLTSRLRDLGLLERVGGPAELVQISRFAPSAGQIGWYLRASQDKRTWRRMARLCSETLASIEENTAEALPVALPKFQTRALELQDTAEITDESIRAGTHRAIGQIQEAAEGRNKGIAFGIPKLDAMTGGCRPGQLVIVAARPGDGKTALGFQVVIEAAGLFCDLPGNGPKNKLKANRLPAGVFSLEMDYTQLVQRELCRRTGLSMVEMASGLEMVAANDRAAAWDKINGWASIIAELPIWVDERGGLTIDQMRSKARFWARTFGIKFLMLDYLQLVSAEAETRALEVGKVSGALRQIAKEENLPTLALCQLNRDGGQRPRISNIRESGNVEQDAHVIILLYEDDECSEERENYRPMILDLAKNRNGATGQIKVWFHKPTMTFGSRY